MTTTPELSCDVLIIGSGAAGLSLALRLAEKHQVIVLSKGPVSEGSTFYAQGGIAAVFDETDSIDSHVEDTLIAGAGICDRHAVEFVASNARSCVQWLIDQGVLFDTQVQPNGEESYHLTREGGHSHRRILHAADATGKEVETTLVSKAQNHPNIRVLERSNAVDLIISDKIGLPGTRRVVGAWIWNRNKESVETCHAKSVVLATGGASKVYQYTTNPDISSGDGIAMAWRAGCRVANLEFNQFHPTALYHPQARNFLLTEALLPYPHNPASIAQDQVDLIVQIERVGDADKIGADATRMTTNPRELLIARSAADVIANSGYFQEGFSLQTGTGGASLAVTRFLEDKMRSRDIHADFALGGITATIVDLHEKGLIRKLLDVQSFDRNAF